MLDILSFFEAIKSHGKKLTEYKMMKNKFKNGFHAYKLSSAKNAKYLSTFNGSKKIGFVKKSWQIIPKNTTEPKPNTFQFASLHISMHKRINNLPLPAANKLLSELTRDGKMEQALQLFHEMGEKTAGTWTILITGYCKIGKLEKARQAFDKMPDRDIVACNAMITGYLQNGQLEMARQLFDYMPERNVATWNAMISGYAKTGLIDIAHLLFHEMPERNAISWTTMVTAYAHHSRMDDAKLLFSRMPFRTAVSWNAMISGCADNGEMEEALRLFKHMLELGLDPTESTLSSVLKIVSHIASINTGKQVHVHVLKRDFFLNSFIGNALITMYAKCGRLQESRTIFLTMVAKDVISWNAIIRAYAQHGYSKESIGLFHEMLHKGFVPNEASFMGVLCACSHSGLVNKGWSFFNSMIRDYRIVARQGHYTCIVDLLGRNGMLHEAEEFIYKMPFEPSPIVWKALLEACRIHLDIERGTRVSELLFAKESMNSGGYLLLSNMYAASGRWEDVAKVRSLMKERGLKRDPGFSWLEVKNAVHVFVSDDRSHSEIRKVLDILCQLHAQMHKSGYVEGSDFELPNFEDEKNVREISYHSEKLAIAYGIISIPNGLPIHVMKNPHMCRDCHSATKFVSQLLRREIVVRDNVRFHSFKNGLCSCGDYW